MATKIEKAKIVSTREETWGEYIQVESEVIVGNKRFWSILELHKHTYDDPKTQYLFGGWLKWKFMGYIIEDKNTGRRIGQREVKHQTWKALYHAIENWANVETGIEGVRA